MPLAAAGEVRALNALLSGVYISLHTADPGASGSNEMAGGGYVRVPATFTNTGSNPTIAANNALVQFPQALTDWGNVSHFGMWSAEVGGDYLAGGPVNVTKSVLTGDIVRWDVGALTVRAD